MENKKPVMRIRIRLHSRGWWGICYTCKQSHIAPGSHYVELSWQGQLVLGKMKIPGIKRFNCHPDCLHGIKNPALRRRAEKRLAVLNSRAVAKATELPTA